MKDFPLSVFSAAARSTVGGVLAFQAGLTGAGLIVFAEGLGRASTWSGGRISCPPRGLAAGSCTYLIPAAASAS